ncbi:unnamed protein product, partial [Trichobilharzia regenti]
MEYKAELHYKCTQIAREIASEEQCEIDMNIVCLATELVFRFYQVLATDLETFSKHAKRSTVTIEDVFCFVRRNPRLVSKPLLPLSEDGTNVSLNCFLTGNRAG